MPENALIHSLSGRLLILTTIFVMLAEVLIWSSIARFREEYMLTRLERAQIASLALADDMLDPELEEELLRNAEVFNGAAPGRGAAIGAGVAYAAHGVADL